MDYSLSAQSPTIKGGIVDALATDDKVSSEATKRVTKSRWKDSKDSNETINAAKQPEFLLLGATSANTALFAHCQANYSIQDAD